MARRRTFPTLAALAVLLTAGVAASAPQTFAQAGIRASGSPEAHSAVAYTIALAHLEQHLVEVRIALPPGAAQRELQLPVWNALYQVRDFAQYVNWVRAFDATGRQIPVHKLNKSLWRISGADGGGSVEYEIFVDSPGPFGAQLNSRHAFLNLAQLLMYAVDERAAPVTVRFNRVPGDWRIATPLEPMPDGQFGAENYDRLVDSPVEIGRFQESDFEEGGAHYRVIVDAESADYDMAKITAMLHTIVSAATSWMDDRPFSDYMFLYHFPHGPAGGGMEHAYSTAIELSAESISGNSMALPGVTAHEFFHLWNVKRIRPQTLAPVDYTRENYTRALWFSEGVTSAAQETILLRGGLLDEARYLESLGDEIGELELRAAHLTQSAEESSLDAWLEGDPYYRRPERSISYYNKGELLGVLLDLAVRDASHGQASLREVLQWMNQHYAKQGKFFADSDGVRQAAEAVSHADLKWFFEKYVAGTEEIPWNQFFASVGLQVRQLSSAVSEVGFTASRNFDGPLVAASVVAGSEAERAGLQVGDTILQINGQAPGADSRQELARMIPGSALALKVRGRRGGERDLKWKVESRVGISYELKDVEHVTPEQRARRTAWLKGEAQTIADAPPRSANTKPADPGSSNP